MEERLNIFNEQGNSIDKNETYENIHRLGLLHSTVHIWLVNSKKQILLQKRAANKRAYPNYWDISVAGHVSHHETSLQGAKRETKEEIGIDFPDSAFILIGKIRQPIIKHSDTFIDNEFNEIYLVECNLSISDFKIQKDEVAEMKWLNLDEFKEWVNGKGEMLVPHEEEYKILLNYLENKWI